MLLGLLVGLAFLPALLTLVGPVEYASAPSCSAESSSELPLTPTTLNETHETHSENASAASSDNIDETAAEPNLTTVVSQSIMDTIQLLMQGLNNPPDTEDILASTADDPVLVEMEDDDGDIWTGTVSNLGRCHLASDKDRRLG